MTDMGKHKRSLSSVDGEVSLRGDPAYGFVLRRALESAAEAPDDWMVSGTYGCAQYNPRPAAASSAASSALDSKRFAVGELSEVGLG